MARAYGMQGIKHIRTGIWFNKQLERARYRWKDNIKRDLKEIKREGGYLIQLFCDKPSVRFL
jgi:hypothetical protein